MREPQAKPSPKKALASGDAEVICGWMEPKPSDTRTNRVTSWWRFGSVDTGWIPRRLTLDALWEVEERLISLGLADIYRTALVRQDEYFWHATAEQKIKALADVNVIRSAVNVPSDTPALPSPDPKQSAEEFSEGGKEYGQ